MDKLKLTRWLNKMHYLDLSLEEIHQALMNHQVTVEELVKESLNRAKKLQKESNAFVTILEKEALLQAQNYQKTIDADNLFYGIPIAIKDNFSTLNIKSTGSSNILNNYVPIFESTVTQKLKDAKTINIGKTVLDELAMGGSGCTGNTGVVKNPLDFNRLIGGSSAGSCAAVAAHVVPFALGSDTGDSVRKPASFGGIVGFKPTWGKLSRYGLFSFAPSLDTVAYFTRNVKDSAYAFDLLNGYDNKDFTSCNRQSEKIYKTIDGNVKGKKIAILKEIYETISNPIVKEKFDAFFQQCLSIGLQVDFISIDKKLYNTIYPTYMILSCAEATSNNANLDGINFGNTQSGQSVDEVVIHTRTKGFSELIKRRFVLGSYILSKENQEKLFIKAKKLRRLIVEDMNRIFNEYDAVMLPASKDIAPLFEGEDLDRLSDEYLLLENHMAIGNFGGFPSITIPCIQNQGLPIGINLTAAAYHDQELLNIAYALEQMLGGNIK